MTNNQGNEQLLRERLRVAVSAFPADELQTQLKTVIEKEKGNNGHFYKIDIMLFCIFRQHSHLARLH